MAEGLDHERGLNKHREEERRYISLCVFGHRDIFFVTLQKCNSNQVKKPILIFSHIVRQKTI